MYVGIFASEQSQSIGVTVQLEREQIKQGIHKRKSEMSKFHLTVSRLIYSTIGPDCCNVVNVCMCVCLSVWH